MANRETIGSILHREDICALASQIRKERGKSLGISEYVIEAPNHTGVYSVPKRFLIFLRFRCVLSSAITCLLFIILDALVLRPSVDSHLIAQIATLAVTRFIVLYLSSWIDAVALVRIPWDYIPLLPDDIAVKKLAIGAGNASEITDITSKYGSLSMGIAIAFSKIVLGTF